MRTADGAFAVLTEDEQRCAACYIEHSTSGCYTVKGGHVCRLARAGATDGCEGPLPEYFAEALDIAWRASYTVEHT